MKPKPTTNKQTNKPATKKEHSASQIEEGTSEGQNLYANHTGAENVGREGLRVVVDVATNLTEGTGWIKKARKRVKSPE